MQFFTKFCPAPSLPQDTVGKSLTQQSFKDDADINKIIKRFQDGTYQNNLMDVSGPRVPMWGDYSSVPDVREAHYFFERAAESFSSLPAQVRQRFNNNPVEMLAFVESASADELKSVFGSKAPVKVDPVIKPVSGVSEVNTETVTNAES